MSNKQKKSLKILLYAGIVGLILLAGAITEARAYSITRLSYAPNSHEGQPAWSPDGTKIAFVSDRDGNQEIYVIDADGTNQIRLTNNDVDDTEPDWSPDGSKIVFSSMSSSYDIHVMNADGSDEIRLTSDEWDERAPAWRYNDSEILYHDSYWNGTIYRMNADGSSQTDLATGRHPSWSSDGTKIVFASNQLGSGAQQIGIMNPDGGNQCQLTCNYPNASEPVCSPAGTKIAFSVRNFSGSPEQFFTPDLYIMDIDGNNQERLTFDERLVSMYCWPLMAYLSPTWSPDGNRIAYARDGDIWVLSGISVRQKTLDGDINSDGIVNFLDLGVLASQWLMTESWYVNSNSVVKDGIEYYVQTDKSVYHLGENVELLYRVTNWIDEHLEPFVQFIFTYGSIDNTCDWMVDKDELRIWDNLGRPRTTAGCSFLLSYSKSFEYTQTWNMTDKNGNNILPGNYNVTGVLGYWKTHDRYVPVSVQIEIIP